MLNASPPAKRSEKPQSLHDAAELLTDFSLRRESLIFFAVAYGRFVSTPDEPRLRRRSYVRQCGLRILYRGTYLLAVVGWKLHYSRSLVGITV